MLEKIVTRLIEIEEVNPENLTKEERTGIKKR